MKRNPWLWFLVIIPLITAVHLSARPYFSGIYPRSPYSGIFSGSSLRQMKSKTHRDLLIAPQQAFYRASLSPTKNLVLVGHRLYTTHGVLVDGNIYNGSGVFRFDVLAAYAKSRLIYYGRSQSPVNILNNIVSDLYEAQ